jgi:hypothetical protein
VTTRRSPFSCSLPATSVLRRNTNTTVLVAAAAVNHNFIAVITVIANQCFRLPGSLGIRSHKALRAEPPIGLSADDALHNSPLTFVVRRIPVRGLSRRSWKRLRVLGWQ